MFRAPRHTYMRAVVTKQNVMRCGLCGRTHDSRTSAQSCVYQCLLKRNSQQPVQMLKASKSLVYRCTYCCREYIENHKAHKCAQDCHSEFNQKFKRFLDLGAIIPDELTTTAADATQASVPPNDEDKFYRDQAKYACQTCHQTYFTKQEVISCYDAHEAN